MASTPGRRLHVIIATVGTRGDTQPYVALGLALQKRGHAVTLATEARMEAFVRSFGLDWRRIEGDSAGLLFEPDAQRALADGSIFRLIRLTSAWEKKLDKAAVLRSYEAALAGADVIVAAGLTMTPCLCLAEHLRVPFIPLLLGPTLRTKAFPLWALSGITLGLRFLNAWTYDVAFKALWAAEKGHVNPWRQSLSLAPLLTKRGVVDVIDQLQPPILIAASRLCCGPGRAVPEDYPANAHVAGFLFVPTVEEGGEAPDPALEGFLAAAAEEGTDVIYLGFGSMPSAEPVALLRLAADVCGQLRCRAVVVAGWSGADAAAAAASHPALLVLPAAPHDWLFPRVKCVVHHAGIGTTAAALRAGVPQVPCPFMLDQPHNARLCVALGAAPAVVPYSSRLRAAALAGAIAAAKDPAQPFAAAAAALAVEVRAESAGTMARFVDVIEAAQPRWQQQQQQQH